MAIISESSEDEVLGTLRPFLATGQQLRDHIIERREEKVRDDGEMPLRDSFCIAMGDLLSYRIEDGVKPLDFAGAVKQLVADCMTDSDSTSTTPRRMPLDVTVFPTARYEYFMNVEAPKYASGAFGQDFARQMEVAQIAVPELVELAEVSREVSVTEVAA